MCEALFKQHTTFLSLAHSPALATAFVAMVQDHYNNLKEEEGDEGAVAHGGAGEDSGRPHGGLASDIEADDEGTSNVVRDDEPHAS